MPTPTGWSDIEYSSITGDANVDSLIAGTQWASTTISYSFPTLSSRWSSDSTDGYGSIGGSGEPWSPYYDSLTSSDQQAIIKILTSWSNVSSLKFTKVTESSTSVGDLRFAYTETPDAQAWAYYPAESPVGGDVWFNTFGTSYIYAWTTGSYEYMTAIHEIGHALGLKHPFETSDYNSQTLDSSLDSRSFTVMSYSADSGDNNTYFSYEPTGPMILDIAAIQALYGVNSSYNAGNTQYVFSGTANYHQTIWDAGGVDTFVYSSSTGGVINLMAGVDGGSTMGWAVYVQDAFFNNLYQVSNIWIANGVVIENATGGSGNDTLLGNAADNVLNGGLGADVLEGGLGNDTYVLDQVGDQVTENADEGTDLVRIGIATAGGSYTLGANVENGGLINAVAYTLSGNALANVLTGNAYANTLNGGDGDDTLDGGAGIDTLVGGDGDDTYVVDRLTDVVSEVADEGSDLVKIKIATTGSYTLGANVEDGMLINAVAYNLTGNGLANILTGNAYANTLDGGAGADSLDGGKGNDTYIVDDLGDTVTETYTNALGGGIDLVKSSVTFTLGVNLDRLTLTGSDDLAGTGNALNNVLTGNSGANLLDGGAGVDSLLGGLGDDTYMVDLTTAGALQDSITEAVGAGTDTLELRGTSSNTVASTITLGANLEELDASATGTSKLNLTGNALANSLLGNAADNVLNGGLGADVLEGGLGNDTYVLDQVGDQVTENADEGTDLVRIGIATAGGSYTLGANVENGGLINAVAYTLSGNALANVLTGNAYANTLNGGDGDDTLDGGAGSDTLAGGAGDDTYVVDRLTDIVSEVADEGSDLVKIKIATTGTYTLGDNIEDGMLINAVAYNLTGNGLANILTGNAYANTLDGGAGADSLDGGKGNDTYIVDDLGDTVTETYTNALGGGIDLVKSSVAFTLGANLDKLTLTGSDDLAGTGNALNNVLTGNSGANLLDGGAGVDSLLGGLGDDTYMVDLTTAGALQDSITEAVGAGTDTLELRGTSSNTVASTITLGANLEELDASATGTSKLNLTGNALANSLLGNAADNVLNGGGGNDILIGGIGNDILVGGTGSDIFLFNEIPDLATNKDTVSDFVSGTDFLQLDYNIFDALSFDTENILISDEFLSGMGVTEASDANQHILFNTSTGALYYDSDGNGGAVAIQFATLSGVTNLVASDICCLV